MIEKNDHMVRLAFNKSGEVIEAKKMPKKKDK
jgi:hypothetical protein